MSKAEPASCRLHGSLAIRARMLEMRRLAVPLLIVALAAVAVYAGTLRYGFIWDDKFLILENRYLREWSELQNNLTSDFFRKTRDTSLIGYWRPLVTFSYMVDRSLFRDQPWGFHLRNVILHALTSCLVLLVARRLPLPRGVPLGAALLFAVHPAHVESVAWISGRTDLLCGLFALAAILLDLEHARSPRLAKRVGSVLATTLALLSKEMGVVLPGVIALRALLLPGDAERDQGRLRSAVRSTLPHAVVLLAYVVVRFWILGVATHQPHWASVGRSVLFWTWWNGFLEYMRVLVWPAMLSVIIEIRHETSVSSISVFAGMALLAGLILAAWRARRSSPGLSFALGCFLLWLIPLTNFLMPINAPTASPFAWSERFLYLPSMGFCLAAAWLLLSGLPAWIVRVTGKERHLKHPPTWAIGLFVAVTAAAGIRAAVRTGEWKDDLSLFGSAVRYAPRASLARLNYGVALANLGRLEEAEVQYLAALELKPLEYRAHYDLGNLYRERGELARAESEYRTALRIRADHAQSSLNLGLALHATGRIQEALEAFTRADELLPGHADAKVNRANVLRLLKRSQSAIPLYKEALALEPTLAPARLGLAQAYFETGRAGEGERILRRLLEDEPDMAEAHLSMAIELEKMGRLQQAEAEFREVLRLDPDNEKVRQRLVLP